MKPLFVTKSEWHEYAVAAVDGRFHVAVGGHPVVEVPSPLDGYALILGAVAAEIAGRGGGAKEIRRLRKALDVATWLRVEYGVGRSGGGQYVLASEGPPVPPFKQRHIYGVARSEVQSLLQRLVALVTRGDGNFRAGNYRVEYRDGLRAERRPVRAQEAGQ